MPPIDLTKALQFARQHHQAGRLPEAEKIYRQILTQQTDHADAAYLLGVIAGQTGRTAEAVPLFSQALELRPDWPEALYNLGNALAATARPDAAADAYQRAISHKPDYFEAYCNLGVVLQETGHANDAVAALEAAIRIRPDLPGLYNNLGNALKELHRYAESISAYRRAIDLQPDLAEAHNNLAVVLKETGRLEESIACCRRAIALRPQFAEAYSSLGVALEETGWLDEALEAYQRAIALKPGYAEAHYNLGNIHKARADLDRSIAAYRQAIALKPTLVEAHNNLVYAMHFDPASDAKSIAEELQRWNQRHAAPLKKFQQPHSNDTRPNRRLRIGYLSPDFREHPVGRFLLPLLANHDKSRFEIFAYSQSSRSDSITQQLRSHIDAWHDIAELSDDATTNLIRQHQIDILIDLTMHMAHNRLLVFARKPAPVQITWLAYCFSTGMDAMDYRISDPHLDPPGMDESIYTEQTIRVPETYWCYAPGVTAIEIHPLPALAQKQITFGCLNNFSKISPPLLACWIKLLHAMPDAQLLLHAPPGSHRQHLLDQLSRAGIDSARIRFAGKAPLADYFRLYHQIDIALDTHPYGGGTTTCDALWMGVPVITLVGKTAVGRGGLSILSNLDLPELIARSEDQYVQIAIDLANDLPRLGELRSTLRQRMEQSVLMDGPRFARNMESVYRQAWSRWCARK
jgi:predicted O-linked N-acetylglucosamine transferase (SPINDLY family)